MTISHSFSTSLQWRPQADRAQRAISEQEQGRSLWRFRLRLDWAVGEILNAIDRNDLADNTLVIFTSDNGPENIAYDRIQEHRHYSMGDLRGVKRDTWEGGHRVPFVARWPGHISPGAVSDEVICLTDLMATIAAVVGSNLPNDIGEDSYNALPALLGEFGSPNSRSNRTPQGQWPVRNSTGQLGIH